MLTRKWNSISLTVGAALLLAGTMMAKADDAVGVARISDNSKIQPTAFQQCADGSCAEAAEGCTDGSCVGGGSACPGGNCLGSNCLGSNCLGGNCLGGNCLGGGAGCPGGMCLPGCGVPGIHPSMVPAWLRPSGCCGKGCPLAGCYDMAYAANPYHFDQRDGSLYAAQGYGTHITVPLAPNVHHTYNYGWGIPSSRITNISTPSGFTTYKPVHW